jgi:hypothetical protein
MSENKMTPTPWKIERSINNSIVSVAGDFKVATATLYRSSYKRIHNGTESADVANANASAIVLAVNATYGNGIDPTAVADLYRSLNSLLLHIMVRPEYDDEEGSELTDLIEIAQDALAKAKFQ